jgi:hypothetical protein
MDQQRLGKSRRAWDASTTGTAGLDREGPLQAIRCPLCEWKPSRSSQWCCYALGTPEPLFDSCETVWNTFLTRGRCPGCRHQWQWTSCHRCGGWSPHDDWYAEQERTT